MDVSIVLVCMNKYTMLKDCLDSIYKYTSGVTYEVWLVAYMFSEENLKLLRQEYPEVKVIESNEIRGFSANNNLALRKATGKYCFILNDDTYFNMDVIGGLFRTCEQHPEISALMPQVRYVNGKVQCSGFPPHSWWEWVQIIFTIKKDVYDPEKKYTSTEGLHETGDLLGAAIFIKTDVLAEMGYLDERYFYGPEDRALTRKMRNNGYQCWVDNDLYITHLFGGSGGSKTKTVMATRPSNRKGWLVYYESDSKLQQFILKSAIWLNSLGRGMIWGIKSLLGKQGAKYMMNAEFNVCKTIFNNQNAIEVFKHFYLKNKKS